MWRTLALASAFFPGLFALCIRLLRWAAPGWSLKDRILLSGRYGRDRREAFRHRLPINGGLGSVTGAGAIRTAQKHRAPAAGSRYPGGGGVPRPQESQAQTLRGEQGLVALPAGNQRAGVTGDPRGWKGRDLETSPRRLHRYGHPGHVPGSPGHGGLSSSSP